MSNSFTQGAGYVLNGLRWLPKAGLRGFVALPPVTLILGGARLFGLELPRPVLGAAGLAFLAGGTVLFFDMP